MMKHRVGDTFKCVKPFAALKAIKLGERYKVVSYDDKNKDYPYVLRQVGKDSGVNQWAVSAAEIVAFFRLSNPRRNVPEV